MQAQQRPPCGGVDCSRGTQPPRDLEGAHRASGDGPEEPSDRKMRSCGVQQLLGLDDVVPVGSGTQGWRDDRPSRQPRERRGERGQLLRLCDVEVVEAPPSWAVCVCQPTKAQQFAGLGRV